MTEGGGRKRKEGHFHFGNSECYQDAATVVVENTGGKEGEEALSQKEEGGIILARGFPAKNFGVCAPFSRKGDGKKIRGNEKTLFTYLVGGYRLPVWPIRKKSIRIHHRERKKSLYRPVGNDSPPDSRNPFKLSCSVLGGDLWTQMLLPHTPDRNKR